jgi:hypothetical protein
MVAADSVVWEICLSSANTMSLSETGISTGAAVVFERRARSMRRPLVMKTVFILTISKRDEWEEWG